MALLSFDANNTNSDANVFRYDYYLLIPTAILLAVGLLVLTSASIGISEHYYSSPLRFLFHQLAYLLCSVGVAIVVMHLPTNYWEDTGAYLLLGALLLLLLVLIPGIGREVNGSTRWISFGYITLQASELTKFSIVIYIAGYLLRREDEVTYQFSGFLKPMAIVTLTSMLLLLEPDFGAAVVIILTVLGVTFLAGARLWQFLLLLAVAGLALGGLAISSPYRLARLTSFLDPWSSPYDGGYQLIQSLIAFGRGGIFGVGLGNSVQKLFYLPEAHTDFLFAILAEEFGILGQMVVLGLFAVLVGRILYLGKLAKQLQEKFIAYLAYGFGLLIGLQVLINIGVNLGVLPTKGLPLPFMSYGGSSMLFNCAIIAIVLRISHELKLKQPAIRASI
jgi:cell division protein FtsW